MTAVLLDLRPAAEPEVPEPAVEVVVMLRKHGTTEAEGVCAACGWHWPCPVYFGARRMLIAAGVPPAMWAT